MWGRGPLRVGLWGREPLRDGLSKDAGRERGPLREGLSFAGAFEGRNIQGCRKYKYHDVSA